MNLASRIRDAIAAPTVVGPTERQVGNGVHESVMRSYQILEIVKDLVRVGTPAKVVLELVEFIEDAIPKNEKARES